MTYRIEITKENNVWKCSVISCDPLPFATYPDNVEEYIFTKTYSELVKLIAEKGYFDLMNKND